MAAERTIHCEDCGAEYRTRRKNTRYCSACRLLRDLLWLADRKAKCVMCDAQFAPLHSRDKLCAQCDFMHSADHGEGDCAVCRGHGRLVRRGLAVCLPCAKDPARRDKIIKALGAKVRRNREAAGAGV